VTTRPVNTGVIIFNTREHDPWTRVACSELKFVACGRRIYGALSSESDLVSGREAVVVTVTSVRC